MLASPLMAPSAATSFNFAHAREICWSFGYLNLTVLWAYQTLLSAQSYYESYFPDAHLDFLGTVAAGSSMFIAHMLQLYFRVYEKASFRLRLFTGYIGYALVGVIVVIPAFRSVGTIVFGFAAVGALNTLTESPLYGLAGLFPPVFTQALQIGNGLAGFLNVLVDALIRGIIDWSKSAIDHDALSYELFVGIMITMSVGAIALFYRLEHLEPVAKRLQELDDQQRANQARVASGTLTLRSSSSQQYQSLGVHQHPAGELASPASPDVYPAYPSTLTTAPEEVHVEIPLRTLVVQLSTLVFAQFYVLFISLLLWPGIPCGTQTHTHSRHEGRCRCGNDCALAFRLDAHRGFSLSPLSPRSLSRVASLVQASPFTAGSPTIRPGGARL